jgi:hypothetical protein
MPAERQSSDMKKIAPVITLRTAVAADEPNVIRLAALDSAPVPPKPLLLGEVDGQLRAAVSLHNGSAIADPFTRSAELVELLRVHARAA